MQNNKPLYFQQVQETFTDWIRKPSDAFPDGVDPERMHVYRKLLIANFQQILNGAFPVTKSILEENIWQMMIEKFFSEYHCKTPYFSEVSIEFMQFIENEGGSGLLDLQPYIYELMHYEWVELGLMTAQNYEISMTNHEAIDDWDNRCLRLSDLAWPFMYTYPVHKLNNENFFQFENVPESSTFLLVYRDHEDSIHFIELTELTYRFLVCLQNNPDRNIIDILDELLDLMGRPCSVERLLLPANEIVSDFVKRGVIY